MSLISQVQNLATRIGTEFKAVRASIGSLTSLSTTNKTNVVAAINEVKAVADAASGTGGGAAINDTTPSSGTVYSSTKTDSLLAAKAADSAVVKLSGAQTVAGVKTFSSAPGVPDGSFTVAKTSGLQAALDEKTTLSAAVAEAKTQILGAAPAALDTLAELSAALGADANFAATTSTALGNRVRIDTAAQGLNATQQGNARANIAAASTAEVGDTTTNFVTTFEAALI